MSATKSIKKAAKTANITGYIYHCIFCGRYTIRDKKKPVPKFCDTKQCRARIYKTSKLP